MTKLSATAQQMAACRSKLDRMLNADLHEGEVECLALLCSDQHASCFLCSSDRAALLAACLLGLRDRCISLEALLTRVGLQKTLPAQYSDQ